jgi:hypothetical protein
MEEREIQNEKKTVHKIQFPARKTGCCGTHLFPENMQSSTVLSSADGSKKSRIVYIGIKARKSQANRKRWRTCERRCSNCQRPNHKTPIDPDEISTEACLQYACMTRVETERTCLVKFSSSWAAVVLPSVLHGRVPQSQHLPRQAAPLPAAAAAVISAA